MTTRIVYYRNDNLVELDNLRSAASSTFVNDATIRMDVVEQGSTVPIQNGGSTVAPSTGLIPLLPVSTTGGYRGTLPFDADLMRRGDYLARITADGGVGLNGYWEIPLISQVRST